MARLHAAAQLGPHINLYRGADLLATFADEATFRVVMNTAGVADFNAQQRAFLSPARYPAPKRPLVAPVDLATSA